MFFIREQRVKIASILLLLNISWISGDVPASSYLPPNRNGPAGKFPPATQTGQRYNPNSAPIETSISLTTSEPLPFNPSSLNDDSRDTSNPSLSKFGQSNFDNSPNDWIPLDVRGNINNNNNYNGNDFNRAAPIRNQQPAGGANGYSYQKPNPPFNEFSAFGPGGSPNNGNNYQPAGFTNSPRPNLFSQDEQNFRPVGPSNTPPAVSNSYFNSPSSPVVYGPPLNNSSGFGGIPGNVPYSSSNLQDRKPAVFSPNTSPNLFRPPVNNQIPANGNVQGFQQNLQGLSGNYGPPNTPEGAFDNFPTLGSSAQLNPNANQFPPSVPKNILSNGKPPGNFGAPGIPQSLYGFPTPDALPNNANIPNRRPNNNFNEGGPSQTFSNSPISPVATSGDRFSPLVNQNKGTFGPPPPSYGPPTNSLPFGSASQAPRPQEFNRLNQNNRPFDNSVAGYQNVSNSPRPSPSQVYGADFSNTPNVGSNQGQNAIGPYSSSNGPPSSIPSRPNNYNLPPNQARPSPPTNAFPTSSLSQTGSPQRVQNQPQPFSPTYELASNQRNPSSPLDRDKSSYPAPNQPPSRYFSNENTPQSSYLPPTSNAITGSSESGLSTSGAYEAPKSPTSAFPSGSGFGKNEIDNDFSRSPSNTLPSGSGFGGANGGGYETSRSPGNTLPSSAAFSTNGIGYDTSRSPVNGIPSTFSSPDNSFSTSYNTPSTNSFNQAFPSAVQQGYSSSLAGSTGFGNIPPTTQIPPLDNSISLSPGYSSPTRDYTDAIIGDYNNLTSPEQGNTYYTNPNSFGDFSNTDGNSQQSQSPPSNQGAPAQSTYSGFSTNPSSPGDPPSRSYGPPKPSDDLFTSEENSLPIGGSGSTNSQTQPELNFSTKPASSYLPPNQASNPSFNPEDIVPSTSYTLPSDQANLSRPSTPNIVKNTNRNVGSDLITGASSSPFLPDSFKSNVPPSRASYEKSQGIAANNLGSNGYKYAKPAKYQFNYDVKGAGPEFNHQESRNGSNTSGSYGVVLPDGRKQIVDYEANLEGFHPKIRYEESTNGSLQQNSPANDNQNQGYNFSPNAPSNQNYSQPLTFNADSFNNPDFGSNYPETQSSYPNRPDYSLGTVANQGSNTSPYDSSSSQTGYPNNDQRLASNYNTYNNQGTSPSNQDGSTFGTNPSSQFEGKQGYDYSPADSSKNQAINYDTGSPADQNLNSGAKQIAYFR